MSNRLWPCCKFQLDKEVEEKERVPAFKRQGLDLSEQEDDKSPSDLRLVDDVNGEKKIRPNSFLHNNVD